MALTDSGLAAGVARRRRNRRRTSVVSMNLVSLMDIFTILVFFLLVNSSNVEVLPGKSSVSLPRSVADAKPEQTLVITVNDQLIMLQGEVITSVDVADNSDVVPALMASLTEYRVKHNKDVRRVTILGDRSISYALLKRVMASCARAGFGDISLAVEQTYRKVTS